MSVTVQDLLDALEATRANDLAAKFTAAFADYDRASTVEVVETSSELLLVVSQP